MGSEMGSRASSWWFEGLGKGLTVFRLFFQTGSDMWCDAENGTGYGDTATTAE